MKTVIWTDSWGNDRESRVLAEFWHAELRFVVIADVSGNFRVLNVGVDERNTLIGQMA